MKKWLIIAGLLLILLIGGYLAIFRSFVPKVSAAFVPAKWQHIPLGQKRIIVYDYLGIPDSTNAGKEYWLQRINDIKRYVLEVQFGKDSIAINYSISYEVDLFGFVQHSAISTDTLR